LFTTETSRRSKARFGIQEERLLTRESWLFDPAFEFSVALGANFIAWREEKQILRFAQDDMSF
jgi:hypothetical protein